MSQAEWIETPAARFPSAPLWSPADGRLYWSDVEDCRLYRFDPDSGACETVLDDGRPVGALALRKDGSILLFRDRGQIAVLSDGAVSDFTVRTQLDIRKARFAAAAPDAAGRIACAAMSDNGHLARLFLLGPDGALSLIREFTGIPAAIAFSNDGTRLLLANSHPTAAGVFGFEYSADSEMPVTGAPSVFVNCVSLSSRREGVPTGVAFARDGKVLVSRRGAAAITVHLADGAKCGAVRLPVRSPVGLCFGGKSGGDLFVTTAGSHRRPFEGMGAGRLAIFRDFSLSAARQDSNSGRAARDSEADGPGQAIETDCAPEASGRPGAAPGSPSAAADAAGVGDQPGATPSADDAPATM